METAPAAAASPLIAQLARPTRAYRIRAWAAMAGLALFLALYFALAAWFLVKGYRLTLGADYAGKDAFWGVIGGACAIFLAVFMLKAVFFVKHGDTGDSIEIKPSDQPELFAFLHQLADKAGAPRPHRVFVSPRVNAAVFYDLSLLNLVFPSRKNLEIGLGLVNALTLGEFRAVLAHEFGHFAQRAMAVGRGVYVAQQIAAHLVARRDKLDDFLSGLSRFDVRIAWIGWALSLIVWSIRSLVESAFQVVLLIQRALSREMEMNADLIAVSLTGSDALINALHRLQAADDAWERAVGFVLTEKANGRQTLDLFAIQAEVVGQMGRLLNDPAYGKLPPPGGETPEERRLFKAEIAQPPQMWLTHPLNHEREANAKRRYIPAAIDQRPAWAVFADAQALREAVTAKLFETSATTTPVAPEDSLAALRAQFEREHYATRYRGIYFGRSIARCTDRVEALCGPPVAVSPASLDELYPESLTSDMELLRSLERELAQLRALQAGILKPQGGTIRHRGKPIRRSGLNDAVRETERELAQLRSGLESHDARCRTLHRSIAMRLGDGWAAYLEGLLAALHFADHTEADLRDRQGVLASMVQTATATRRVSARDVERIVSEATALHAVLHRFYEEVAPRVRLDTVLLARFEAKSFSDALGAFGMGAPSKENISEWLQALGSWIDHAAGTLSALRLRALEQLLTTEAAMAAYLRDNVRPEPAPEPSRVPDRYDTLPYGTERKRETKRSFWARFQNAEGVVPAGARLVVAGAIVGSVLGLGGSVGSANVNIYNGLASPVVIRMGSQDKLHVPAFGARTVQVDPDQKLSIEARSRTGELIERFDAEVRGAYGQNVYNVASAAPLVEWTATYGNAAAQEDRPLGAPRWTSTSADIVFEEAPKSISTKGGGGTRRVLSGLGEAPPGQLLGMLKNDDERMRLIATRARWDALDSAHVAEWLSMALSAPDKGDILRARLAAAPDEVLLLRIEEDSAMGAEREAVCERHRRRASASPQNADIRYLEVRCLPEGPGKDLAFLDGHQRHPEHGWFAYAAGYVDAQEARWPQALARLEVARRNVPALTDSISVDMARIHRLVSPGNDKVLRDLGVRSETVRRLLTLESGEGLPSPAHQAYAELGRGNVERAVTMAQTRPQSEARLRRLAAASDGASSALVRHALSTPADQGIDDATVWASIALATRAGSDTAQLRQLAGRAVAAQSVPMLAFVDALKAGRPPAEAERHIAALPPELRGHCYSMGTVMLGSKAPAAWRNGAKRLLFASERPYFS